MTRLQKGLNALSFSLLLFFDSSGGSFSGIPGVVDVITSSVGDNQAKLLTSWRRRGWCGFYRLAPPFVRRFGILLSDWSTRSGSRFGFRRVAVAPVKFGYSVLVSTGKLADFGRFFRCSAAFHRLECESESIAAQMASEQIVSALRRVDSALSPSVAGCLKT